MASPLDRKVTQFRYINSDIAKVVEVVKDLEAFRYANSGIALGCTIERRKTLRRYFAFSMCQ